MTSYGTAAPESDDVNAQLLATSAAKGAFAYVKTQLLRARVSGRQILLYNN